MSVTQKSKLMTSLRKNDFLSLHLFAHNASVAKLVDAQDLKSWDSVKRSCRFKSGPRHHFPLKINKIPRLQGNHRVTLWHPIWSIDEHECALSDAVLMPFKNAEKLVIVAVSKIK
jgi:hypothetical protein